jgi:hypothetical protein
MGMEERVSTANAHIRQVDRDMRSTLLYREVSHDYCPVITVSRQQGSSGVEIGELTARKLGYEFLDRAIVEAIAEKASIEKSVVESLDERASSMLAEFLRDTLKPGDLSRQKYIEHLAGLLIVKAEMGKAVIVGRGAHIILKAFPLFRVRIICPKKIRVERLAARYDILIKDAREMVKRSDNERSAFMKNFFTTDIDDSTHYDLLVNTERIDEEQASDIIVHSYRAAFCREECPVNDSCGETVQRPAQD